MFTSSGGFMYVVGMYSYMYLSDGSRISGSAANVKNSQRVLD